MVFLQSELAVTLFCGFMKSTPLCMNRRLEQLQNKRGSEVVKTDAGFTAGVNRILLVALNFWWRSKVWKEKSSHCWEKESGTFQIIIEHWPDAESCWEKVFAVQGLPIRSAVRATWREPKQSRWIPQPDTAVGPSHLCALKANYLISVARCIWAQVEGKVATTYFF